MERAFHKHPRDTMSLIGSANAFFNGKFLNFEKIMNQDSIGWFDWNLGINRPQHDPLLTKVVVQLQEKGNPDR